MNCPVDGAELRISERQGIEIDYCPQCRGVWLDRGELDEIIERAAPAAATPASVPHPAQQPAYPQHQPAHLRRHGRLFGDVAVATVSYRVEARGQRLDLRHQRFHFVRRAAACIVREARFEQRLQLRRLAALVFQHLSELIERSSGARAGGIVPCGAPTRPKHLLGYGFGGCSVWLSGWQGATLRATNCRMPRERPAHRHKPAEALPCSLLPRWQGSNKPTHLLPKLNGLSNRRSRTRSR